MATVRITNDIRDHVRNEFEALYSERIERKEEELQNLDIGNVCYLHYIPDKYRKLAEQLNADDDGKWVGELSEITIEMTYLKNDADRTENTVTFIVPFKSPVPVPQRMFGYRAKFKLIESMAPYKHAKNIWLEINALDEECDKLVAQIVDGVLTKCSTLRQVLELWPTALDFMPDDVKQKHAAKTEKRQSVTEELLIDDDVKASLIKTRMLAAGR